MKQPLVSIIIVNWNGLEHLQKCLPLLLQIQYLAYEVIVVDNYSSDDSVRYLREHFPAVKIVENSKNDGFAEGNNLGYRAAQGKYILLLNNDTTVDKHFLTELVDFIEERPNVAVVQPKILIMNEPSKVQLVGSYLTSNGFMYYIGYHRPQSDFSKPLEIFSALGACMLIRKSVIEKVGLFDADFFAYLEETDFCWRVWLAGYQIWYVPESIIYHKGAGTSSKMALAFIYYHSYKNRLSSLIKNLGLVHLFMIVPTQLLYIFFYSVWLFFHKQWRYSLAMYQAIWWNVVHFKTIWMKRISIQKKMRRVSDVALWPHITRRVTFRYYYYLLRGLDKQDY